MTDQHAARLCRERWNAIAKPLFSLGRLEEAVCRLAAIQGTPEVDIGRRVCLVVCADNGVVSEGVTQADAGVTALQAACIARGGASVNAMARAANCDVLAVDVGMLTEPEEPRLLRRKAARGTGNMAKGPAMTVEQLEATLKTGMDLAREMQEQGYQIICMGEMGIGNTTTTAAMASVLLGQPPEAVTSRGAGLSDAGLVRKLAAVQSAIRVNRPDPKDPRDVLRKLGGFDIAAMAGICLGAEQHRMPVVVDGVIAAVAALAAVRMSPGCRDYLLASHLSREPAAGLALEALGLQPLIHADMALGEGTGAVALLPLLDLALAVYRGSNTFSALKMPAYQPQGGGA